MEPNKGIKLPLSSFITNLPSNLITNLIISIILPRIKFLESNLLLLNPLNNLLLFKFQLNSTLVLLSNLLLIILGIKKLRIKNKLNFCFEFLNLLEGIKLTLDFLNSLENGSNNNDSPQNIVEKEQEETIERNETIKHLLSFWLLFSIITLSVSYNKLPSSSSPSPTSTSTLSNQWNLPSIINSLHTTITNLLPTEVSNFISPSTTSTSTLSPISSLPISFPEPSIFPPPSSLPASRNSKSSNQKLQIQSLPFSFNISPTTRYKILKLLILWIGIRKDQFGSLSLWNYILSPIYDLFVKGREISLGGEAGRGEGGKKVVEIVVRDTPSTTTPHVKPTTTTNSIPSPAPIPSSNHSSSSSSSSGSSSSGKSNSTISYSTSSRIPQPITPSKIPRSDSLENYLRREIPKYDGKSSSSRRGGGGKRVSKDLGTGGGGYEVSSGSGGGGGVSWEGAGVGGDWE